MPTRTAFIITIGDVIESGPPRASRSSNKANNQSSGENSEGEDSVASDHRPQSPASSINSDATQTETPRPRRFRKRNRMKTRVSNTGGSSANAVAESNSNSNSSNVVNGTNGGGGSNGRRSRLQSVDQVYLGNSNNNPLSPRTRSSVKQEIDDEVSFVDPLSLEESKSGCNGNLENGHLEEDSVDPLDTTMTNGQCTGPSTIALKKKRKSSAEKFLEDQSEYYGFQVLPSKLRSSSVESNLSNSTFLENSSNSFTTTATTNDAGTNVVQAEADAATDAADLGDILGAGEHETEEKPPRRHRTTSSHSDFENATRDRSRHSSGASSTKRRIRANSSSSNHHSECINATKKLRVEVTKVDDMIKQENSELEASSSDEITENAERSQRKKLRSRRSADTNSSEKTANSLSPVSKKRRSELDKLLEAGSSSFHCESAKQAADRLGPLKVDVSDGSEAGSYEACENFKSPGKSRLLQEADVNQNSKSPGRRASRSPKKGGRGGGRGRGRRVGNKANDSEADLSVSPVSSSAFSPCVPNDMVDALKRVDSHEVEISSMDFSFERTPFRESWFQTYTRQDAGDEILYYPEIQSFPLPYEMPMNTFYPRKDFKKNITKSGRNTPSGTATPDEEEFVEPTPTRSTRRGQEAAAQPSTSKSGKSTKNKNLPFSSEELSFFEKIGPKKAAALRAASERKSPRGHASTKSLNAASPYVDDVDDAEFEELIDGAKKPVKKYVLAYKALMANSEEADPEASNDSLASSISTRKDESLEKLGEIAGQLESFFSNSLDDASLLPASSTSEQLHKKRSRRQSSSEKAAGSSKKVKKSKNNEAGEILDKLLDSNVDPVFLDCLEDELPSVVFDEHHPKLDTMDLINDFDQCTSINLFKKKQKRKEVIESALASDSEAAITAATSSASKDPNSTILRRLLTHSTESKKNKVAASKNNRSKALDIPIPNDDSSSECNSAFETASVASSTSRRKRKRNMTGFPSPKKKKKIIKAVPTPPPPAAPSSSGKPVKLKKIIIPKKSTLRKAAEKAAKKARAQEANKGKSSVQLKLKMNKNGLGLQRPSKSPTKVPSATTTLAASKKAKPSPKSTLAKKTSTKRTSRSSVPPPPPKTEVIQIESSDDEDDNEDRTFRLKNKVTKKRKRTKKKRRPLTVKSKKPVIPKLINIDDDEVDVENEGEDSDDSVANDSSAADEEEDNTSDEDNQDSDEEEEEEDDDENSDEEDSDASDEEDRPIKPKLKKAGPKGRRSLRARNNKS